MQVSHQLAIFSRKNWCSAHPSLLDGPSSENISAAVIELSDEVAYVRPNHVDPEGAFTSLATPPSLNKTTTLRTRTVLLDSKVRKPMFQDDEDKGKATDLGDEMLEKATDLLKPMRLFFILSKITSGPTPLPANRKQKSPVYRRHDASALIWDYFALLMYIIISDTFSDGDDRFTFWIFILLEAGGVYLFVLKSMRPNQPPTLMIQRCCLRDPLFLNYTVLESVCDFSHLYFVIGDDNV